MFYNVENISKFRTDLTKGLLKGWILEVGFQNHAYMNFRLKPISFFHSIHGLKAVATEDKA